MKNITKRLLGVLLTVAMIIGLVTVPAFAYKMDPNDALITKAETYLAIDSSDDAAPLVKNQSTIGKNDEWLVVSHDGAAHNITDGVFTLKGAGSGTSIVFRYQKAAAGSSVDGLTGDLNYEFDFKLDTLGDVNVFFSPRAISNGSTIHFPQLQIKNGKVVGNGTQEGSAPTLPSPSVVPGTWHNIRLAYHVTRGANGTYDVYMDDVLILKDKVCNNGNRGWNEDEVRQVGNLYFQQALVDVQYKNFKIWREPVGLTTVAADDFNGYTAEKTYTGGVADTFLGMPLHVGGAYPKGVTIKDGKAHVAPVDGQTRFFGNYAPGYANRKQLFVEFDFIPNQATHGNFFRVTDPNGSNQGACIKSTNGVFYAFGGGRAGQGGSDGIRLASHATDGKTTYNFKLYIDLDKTFTSGGNTFHGKYDIYINDKCVQKDLGLYYNGTTDITQFGRTFLWMDEQKGTVVFDKIAFREDVREKVLSDAITTLYATYPNQTLTAGAISLPTSTVDGYTITWTSSNPAVVDTASGRVGDVDEATTVTLTATVKDTNNEYSISRKYDFTVLGTVNSILKQDFEGAAPGTSITGVTWTLPANYSIASGLNAEVRTIAKDGKDSNKAIYIGTAVNEEGLTITEGRFQVNHPNVILSNVITEASFMQPEKGYVNDILKLGTKNGKSWPVRIYSNGTDIVYEEDGEAWNNTHHKVLVKNYEAGRWYNFKAYVDVETDMQEIYVDDVCVVSKALLGESTVGDGGTVGIGRVFGSFSGGNAKPYYIDDIKVYTSAIEDKLFAIDKVNREAASSFSLPATANGLPITWASTDSSKIAISGTDATVTNGAVNEDVVITATVDGNTKKYAITVLGGVTVSATRDGNEVVGKVYYPGLLSRIDEDAMVVVAIYNKDSGKLEAGKIGSLNGDYLTAGFAIGSFAEGDYVVKTYVFGNIEDGMKPIVETPAVHEFTK